MGININPPNITSTTPDGKIQQLQSYLYQMAGQLNWALSSIDTYNSDNNASSSAVKFEQSEGVTPQEAEETFNSIKALIIKSADIVKAYEETIISNFKGKYFADSDFGTYIEETSRTVVENSKYVEDIYLNVQSITNDDRTGTLDVLAEETRTTNAYIKRGLLGYDEDGNAIYGVEVGETNEEGAFSKYARFKSDRLSFYDANGTEVAYIGAGCLYILGKSAFIGEVQFGGYKMDTSDCVAFTWIG